MEPDQAVIKLAALAQHSRLAVFRHLVQSAPQPVSAGKLSETLAIPKATLSFHLKELSHAGLVLGEQDGRNIYYRANLDEMSALMAYLLENCCQGEACAPATSALC